MYFSKEKVRVVLKIYKNKFLNVKLYHQNLIDFILNLSFNSFQIFDKKVKKDTSYLCMYLRTSYIFGWTTMIGSNVFPRDNHHPGGNKI